MISQDVANVYDVEAAAVQVWDMLKQNLIGNLIAMASTIERWPPTNRNTCTCVLSIIIRRLKVNQL